MTSGDGDWGTLQPLPAEKLPAMVQNELRHLSVEQLEAFREEFQRRKKSKLWAWVTWFVHSRRVRTRSSTCAVGCGGVVTAARPTSTTTTRARGPSDRDRTRSSRT